MSISWNVYGKISSVVKNGNATNIEYSYDVAGNRIGKKAGDKTTLYVRDASGNVMSVYESKGSVAFGLKESHLYGSSRLGIQKGASVITESLSISTGYGKAKSSIFIRGQKFFELSNHLGNVLATVSDRKIQVGTGTIIEYYNADVASAQDYYPFGMIQPGRKYNIEGYRYGFNGKENDNEIKGEGNQLDYGMRVYEPRIGKFLSVDPLADNYPFYTPYQYAGNKPIRFVDLDGLEEANPSIFRKAWNAINGDFHLNRMDKYLTKQGLNSDNVITLNNETSIVFQTIKNPNTGSPETYYSIFRKAKLMNGSLVHVAGSADDDIGLTEQQFSTTKVLSNQVVDAPIGLGVGAGKILLNGSKGLTYSFRQTVGVAKEGLRALNNWKNEIKFGIADVTGVSQDVLKKGFHLHFKNLKNLELGLAATEDGKISLSFIMGTAEHVKDGVKLFSQAMGATSFRATLLSKLKMTEEALVDGARFFAAGSENAKMAANRLEEVKKVTEAVLQYGK